MWRIITHLLEQAEGDTSTEELAQVLLGELAQSVENVLLDLLGLRVGLGRVIGNRAGREVGVVDRIVDRDGDLKAGVVVDHGAGNTGPHGLMIGASRLKRGRSATRAIVLTVRLVYATTLGLFPEATLESLRRTASEGLEVNW